MSPQFGNDNAHKSAGPLRTFAPALGIAAATALAWAGLSFARPKSLSPEILHNMRSLVEENGTGKMTSGAYKHSLQTKTRDFFFRLYSEDSGRQILAVSRIGSGEALTLDASSGKFLSTHNTGDPMMFLRIAAQQIGAYELKSQR